MEPLALYYMYNALNYTDIRKRGDQKRCAAVRAAAMEKFFYDKFLQEVDPLWRATKNVGMQAWFCRSFYPGIQEILNRLSDIAYLSGDRRFIPTYHIRMLETISDEVIEFLMPYNTTELLTSM